MCDRSASYVYSTTALNSLISSVLVTGMSSYGLVYDMITSFWRGRAWALYKVRLMGNRIQGPSAINMWSTVLRVSKLFARSQTGCSASGDIHKATEFSHCCCAIFSPSTRKEDNTTGRLGFIMVGWAAISLRKHFATGSLASFYAHL